MRFNIPLQFATEDHRQVVDHVGCLFPCWLQIGIRKSCAARCRLIDVMEWFVQCNHNTGTACFTLGGRRSEQGSVGQGSVIRHWSNVIFPSVKFCRDLTSKSKDCVPFVTCGVVSVSSPVRYSGLSSPGYGILSHREINLYAHGHLPPGPAYAYLARDIPLHSVSIHQYRHEIAARTQTCSDQGCTEQSQQLEPGYDELR